eukprot:981222-Amphidinium_carterae.8
MNSVEDLTADYREQNGNVETHNEEVANAQDTIGDGEVIACVDVDVGFDVNVDVEEVSRCPRNRRTGACTHSKHLELCFLSNLVNGSANVHTIRANERLQLVQTARDYIQLQHRSC